MTDEENCDICEEREAVTTVRLCDGCHNDVLAEVVKKKHEQHQPNANLG